MDNRIHSIVSADIVSSTSMSVDELSELTKEIHSEFGRLRNFLKDDFWGRVVKGDSIECYVEDPCQSLRTALILKCLVKEFSLKNPTCGSKAFKKHALRFSIGIGTLNSQSGPEGLLMGEAVNYAGRNLDSMGKSPSRLSSVATSDSDLSLILDGIARALNMVIDGATAKQCQVLRRLMYGMTETEIGREIGISQGGVSIRSKTGYWGIVKYQLGLFEKQIKK